MRLTACLITPIVKAQRYKADVMKDPKPLKYPFENPSITVGLAAINATEPPFKVEPKHLTAWFKEGVIARYMLLDDIREMWGKEALSAKFEEIFGGVKHCTLIASKVSDKDWNTLEAIEMATYGVYAIDTAAALYSGTTHPTHEKNGQDAQNADGENARFDYPMPEPVLPRYEAEKIYSMLHNQPIPEKEPRTNETKNVYKALGESIAKHGFTEKDFNGSIKQLQSKIANKGLNGVLTSITDKTLIDWLKKAEVRKP
ncbi:Xylanase-like protein (modular protein) [Xenorhabdus bovienii str. kraussei Quebec]|uniref:Xylanase-like protein (Modular protein) n=2 Tax=Xenorhabdus bovienii TaxID=40576 RepID=A0A077PGY0_XENBV|nr:Xylanase-like protein (modular protein) [Xenorhabdus bovienii str. kraussei Quebec]